MKEIKKLLNKFKIFPEKIVSLKGDGSNRKFFRIFFKNSSLILIFPQEGEYGLKEAECYYELGVFFRNKNIPVPEIKLWDKETGILLVEDLGDIHLFDIKKDYKRFIKYYFQIIEILIKFQQLKTDFPKNKTLDTPIYDLKFLWEKEILYFLEWYFQKFKKYSLNKNILNILKNWAEKNSQFIDLVVMHRDFQSKNIMIKDNKIYIVDFQGARLGPPSYDLASLLYDPYVEIEEKDKKKLLNFYLKNSSYSENKFLKELNFIKTIRLMQALGAYCKLNSGGKNWFKKYIPITEKRLKNFLKILFQK